MKNEWPKKRLGEVCEIIMGQSPDGASYNTTGEGVPLINGPVEFSDESFGKTVRSKFTTEPTKFCKEGDLILCVRGSTTGRMNIAGFDACVGRGVAAIRAKEYQPWINHFISSQRDEIHGKGTGATFPNVSAATLADFELVVPPLPEQQRIVGLLDEAFAGLATAKANAEKNFQNARALFESHLQSVFTQRGKGWVETKLDDVTDLITCGVAKRPEYVPEGIPFLSAKNVKNGQVVWSGYQYVSQETHRALTKNNKPRKGDILYTRVGSYGEAAIIDRDVEFSIFVSLTLIKPKPVLLNAFLKHYLNSSAVKQLAAGSITGVGVGNLNVGTVREFPIHLPPASEQRSIVAALDGLRQETQHLASLYERKLAALEALKKSLLHQAFSGEL